jgi:hypothetical protein
MADIDISLLTKAAQEKGMSLSDLQGLAARNGITLEAAAAKVGINVADITRRVLATINKGEAILADTGKGAALGATIGTAVGPWGTAVGGVVGTAAGAVYGVIDNFGGDIADFASSLFGGGPDPTCHDFFGAIGGCDNIDRRNNNVAKMQRDVRADPKLLSITPANAVHKWDVELPYAQRLLALENERQTKITSNEKMADHILHATPAAILGLKPCFGVWFHNRDDLVKNFKVPPEYADQMLSAARKLMKAAPPPTPPAPKKKIGVSVLSPGMLTLNASAIRAAAGIPTPPTAAAARALRDVSLAEWTRYYDDNAAIKGVP